MRRIRISRLQHLVLDAGSGLYSLAGHNSDLLKARHIIASLLPGTYTLAGNNATLTRQTRLLNTISGTYSYVGSPATLTWATSPNITTAPVIIGIPTVGTPVAYTAGNVTGSPTPTRTQQWLLDGNTIAGATASTYTPITSDAGHNLAVRQIETNTFGSANRTSAGVVIAGIAGVPTWSGTIPTELFTKGTASSPVSLAPYLTNYDASTYSVQVTSGVLPTGVAINQTTPSLTYNDGTSVVGSGTNPIILTLTPNGTADFASRATGAYFAENFSTYASTTAWYNFWNRGSLVGTWISSSKSPSNATVWNNSWELITDPTHVKSGKALRAYMGKNASDGSGTLDSQWAIMPLSGNPLDVPGSYHLKYYFQAVVWVDEYIDYKWAIPGGGSAGAKFFILEAWNRTNFADPGECVIDSNMTYPGFITGYHTWGGGTNPISRTWERGQAIPSNNNSFAGQGGVDTGSALDGTDASYYRRYGPMYQMPPSSNQGSMMHLQGIPNTNAAIGGVAWNRGGFTVIEVECDAIAHRCRVWAAWYGNAPKLVHDSGIGGAFNISLNDGIGNGFSGAAMSNLVYTSTEGTNPGRPATPYIDYVELIAHPNPIKFPGNFQPPGT